MSRPLDDQPLPCTRVTLAGQARRRLLQAGARGRAHPRCAPVRYRIRWRHAALWTDRRWLPHPPAVPRPGRPGARGQGLHHDLHHDRPHDRRAPGRTPPCRLGAGRLPDPQNLRPAELLAIILFGARRRQNAECRVLRRVIKRVSFIVMPLSRPMRPHSRVARDTGRDIYRVARQSAAKPIEEHAQRGTRQPRWKQRLEPGRT